MEAIFQEKQKKRPLAGLVLKLAVRLALKNASVSSIANSNKYFCSGQVLNLRIHGRGREVRNG
jgi:hypothetical protein